MGYLPCLIAMGEASASLNPIIGNALIGLAFFNKRVKASAMLANWCATWCGNLMGTALVAYLFYLAGLTMGNDLVNNFVIATANKKLALTSLQTIISAFFCNVIISLAVWGSMAGKDIAGFNNVDLKAAEELGLPVVRVPEYSPYAVAEFAMGLLLTLNRKIHKAYNRVKDMDFSVDGLLGFDLNGKHMGVIAYDPLRNEDKAKELGFTYTSLEDIYAKSDIIALHCPLTKDNHHLINKKSIAKMKKGVYLINTSRGGLYKAEDVIEGLKSGHIGGFAADVYEKESGLFFEDCSQDPEGKPNPEAVRYYNDMLDTLIDSGVEPSLALFHFDTPACLMEKGGWENRDILALFERYAHTCFDLFGDKVTHWYTFNEPIVPILTGYVYNLMPPYLVDFQRGITVAYHTVLAHALAVKAFKAKPRKNDIGVILNIASMYPRSNNAGDVKATHIADLLFNRSFLDPCLLGRYPQELIDFLKEKDLMPNVQEGDRELIEEGKVSRLGVNYYTPMRFQVKAHLKNPEAPVMPEDFFDTYNLPGCRMNPYRGWEIFPKGLYDVLSDIRENYGNPDCIISENGMGVENEDRFRNKEGEIQDSYRIEFIRDHLKWLHKAIEEGSRCHGYYLWTFADNWSWSNAYKNRYGYVEVDLADNLKRKLKASAHWIKKVIQENGFEA
ncbi:UNVERIFIED_CONTAM: hypothetical protein PYX00_011913 [Menopon gallinae]|uniref:D-isomer specific 2-hydroxyacid dehydrogenase NAD-binding domain-containing protein n=1 Tax=Menopon gallinae TaxID=328185 RepID=A0AAW2H922_9NEOP